MHVHACYGTASGRRTGPIVVLTTLAVPPSLTIRPTGVGIPDRTGSDGGRRLLACYHLRVVRPAALLGARPPGRWLLGAVLVTLLLSHLGVCQDAPSPSVASCTHGPGHALLCSAEAMSAGVAELRPQRDPHLPPVPGHPLPWWFVGVVVVLVSGRGRKLGKGPEHSLCSHAMRLAVLQVLRR